MKIVYFILAHNNPEQLIHLIRRLNTGDGVSFVIHFDVGGSINDYNDLADAVKDNRNVHFTSQRHQCFWGDYSLVSATIECIKCALDNEVDFGYAFLLSGQDFPLKSNKEIRNFLTENTGKEFISAYKLPNTFWSSENGGMDRVDYFHFNRFKRNDSSIKKRISSFITGLLKKYKIKRKHPNIEFYSGSQWWCLSREFLQYAHNYINSNKKINNFFKFVFVPDEMFFQTIIMNSPFKERVANDHLRYIDWSREEKPAVFRTGDFESLIAQEKLFARKFDMNEDNMILKLLDDYVAERGVSL